MSDFLPTEMERFRCQALPFGVHLSPRQLQLLEIYLDELWEWARRINLAGAATRRRILTELILDSLIPHAHLPEVERLLDVGTGAGLPGIPLKICRPEMALNLIEANSRKVSFLRHVIRRMRLGQVEVFHGRAEKEAVLPGGRKYPLVTARAVAPLSRTVTWFAPYVANGGILTAFQGEAAEASLKGAREVMEASGLTAESVIPYRLPGKRNPRHLLLLRRVSASTQP